MSNKSSDVRAVGQHMFTPITHPELRRLGRKTVHKFPREREQYLLRIAESQSAGSTITLISLRSSIDRDLLESLLSSKTFKYIDNFDDLTDSVLDTWLTERDGVKLESISLEDLEAAVKSAVKINVHEPDAEMRIFSLFSDYRTLLRSKKWERLIKDSPKVAIRQVTSLLRPAVLKSKLEQDIRLDVDGIKVNW